MYNVSNHFGQCSSAPISSYSLLILLFYMRACVSSIICKCPIIYIYIWHIGEYSLQILHNIAEIEAKKMEIVRNYRIRVRKSILGRASYFISQTISFQTVQELVQHYQGNMSCPFTDRFLFFYIKVYTCVQYYNRFMSKT